MKSIDMIPLLSHELYGQLNDKLGHQLRGQFDNQFYDQLYWSLNVAYISQLDDQIREWSRR